MLSILIIIIIFMKPMMHLVLIFLTPHPRNSTNTDMICIDYFQNYFASYHNSFHGGFLICSLLSVDVECHIPEKVIITLCHHFIMHCWNSF